VSTLLRDILVIPEHAGVEDYVLRLTDSVGGAAAARTVDEYVVTPDLANAFDLALGLVAESVTSGVSRGDFLVGSFGSGKSHFMAVLHALLRDDPVARAKADLQSIVAKHDGILQPRAIFPLAFHLLGARSLEQALFDGYIRQASALHPNAPLPALHESDGIIADAERLREGMGDEQFFAKLDSETSGADADPWAGLIGPGAWSAERYASARAAAAGSDARQRLVTALADRFFSAYTQQATYVDLDTGLAAIADHAKQLGYDAVVLFLDELVLWLAFSVQDKGFFARESQKLTKLVESGIGGRAIPLVSFVARQLDLRRWFADAGASGAEQEALDRAFRHQEGRFGKITLGDENLPFVARQRLLRRRSEGADQILTDAFARLDRRRDVWDVLLDGINTDEQHRGADEEAFRLTYPFSPALISTLRSLASVMQRERTALKVMQQMLVEQRDTLTVDDVIPLGDAFDHIVKGGDPLDSPTAALFKAATALYREKLRPLILKAHNLTEDESSRSTPALPRAFIADDRLAKTLLLSAVAPKVPALKELTAARLASLNHGSITSPLPGGEASTVLTRVKEWALRVPEIHVDSDARNPVVRVALSDVDYESIVERAKGEDNEGRRRELIKDLVREALQLTSRDPDMYGVNEHAIVWRGSRRTIDVVFGNVRDAGWLTEDHFRARPGTWRFVIDHPFDERGFSAADDFTRLDRLRDGGLQGQTIVWLPRFLAEDRMRDVRRLVVLDWLLGGAGERWRANADHLSEVDRVQARAILESNRTAVRAGLRRAIQESYGAAAPTPGTLVHDEAHEKVLVSLSPSFTPSLPVGADLGAAFTNLVDQAFTVSYPGHPRFEPPDHEVTVRELSTVYRYVERAVADPDGRVRMEADAAAVRRIANPLQVGTASETHFLFGDDRFSVWGTHFERALSRAGLAADAPVTVGAIRDWIDEMAPPMGLRSEVADLIILAWAALRQRAWYQYGASIPAPRAGDIRSEMELRTQPLPSQETWERATQRAAAVFGLAVNPYRTAPGVAQFCDQVRRTSVERSPAASALAHHLDQAYQRLHVTREGAGRLATANAVSRLLDSLQTSGDHVALVNALAAAQLLTTDAAAAISLSRAVEVSAALDGYRWERLGSLRETAANDDERGRSALRILNELSAAVEADEFTVPLRPALQQAEDAIFAWLSAAAGQTAVAQGPSPKPLGPDDVPLDVRPFGASGRATRPGGAPPEAVVDELVAFLREHADEKVVIEWRVEK
jgi:hypothetical protein